jgi:DNA polymerase kappa
MESLTFVKSDFELYKNKSMEVRAVLEEFDPNLSMYSLDEAYMDIGPYLEIQLLDATKDHDAIRNVLSAANESTPALSERLHEYHSKDSIHDAARSLLHSIREKVRTVTGLTCSAGLCSNFLLAKIASDINKPNGQHFVGPSEQEILEFIHPLPLRKVNGIGRVMEKILRGVSNIETVKDLYIKRSDVHVLFKPATAHFLLRASIGYSESKQHESADDETGDAGDETLHRKGISHERTFSPTSSWNELCTKLEKISLCLVHDLREKNLRPKTITLKVKLSSFDILTRATTRDIALFQNCNNSHSPQDLVDIVVHMLKEVKREHDNRSPTKKSQSSNNPGSPFSVRLLGVRCSNFQLNEDNQQSLYRYQFFQNLINAENHPLFDNNSPIVKNPYGRPKFFTSNYEKLSTGSSAHNMLPPSDQKLPSAKKVTTKTSDETELEENRLQCPLCNKYFESDEDGNAVLNAHIDACLNATAVKQLAREETVCADERIRKKKCKLADFFGS